VLFRSERTQAERLAAERARERAERDAQAAHAAEERAAAQVRASEAAGEKARAETLALEAERRKVESERQALAAAELHQHAEDEARSVADARSHASAERAELRGRLAGARMRSLVRSWMPALRRGAIAGVAILVLVAIVTFIAIPPGSPRSTVESQPPSLRLDRELKKDVSRTDASARSSRRAPDPSK
jgi:hypothetical protein